MVLLLFRLNNEVNLFESLFYLLFSKMNWITRTPNQIKEKIEGWLLRHEQKGEDQFNGDEVFTLVSKLNPTGLQQLNDELRLHKFEIPVLILFTGTESFIVNTTERFIHISGANIEAINYKDFDCHLGFVSILEKQNADRTAFKGIKTEGGFQEFAIKSKSSKTTYWTVPTGKPGFSFWNVTNQCEVIGRRFLLKYD